MAILTKKIEIQNLRKSGEILTHTLAILHNFCLKNTNFTGLDLENIAQNEIKNADATPAFFGVPSHGLPDFPAALCISANDECVHGIPDSRPIPAGTVLKIDCGVIFGGIFTDSAFTVTVGDISNPKNDNLLAANKEILREQTKIIRPGLDIREIGHIAENIAQKYGVSIIRDLCGHGVGHSVHEEPTIFNYFEKSQKKYKLNEGEVIAIEPILAAGHGELAKTKKPEWVIRTADHSTTSQFEWTVLVTADGCEIITPIDTFLDF